MRSAMEQRKRDRCWKCQHLRYAPRRCCKGHRLGDACDQYVTQPSIEWMERKAREGM